MNLKKLLFVALSGLGISFNAWCDGVPEFDKDGYFHFNFTQPVLDMLAERLADLPEKIEPFSFNQEQFEGLVKKINEIGWCELNNSEKQQIVEILLSANQTPTKQTKEFLLKLLDTMREINDQGMTMFSPSPDDERVYAYMNLLFAVINR